MPCLKIVSLREKIDVELFLLPTLHKKITSQRLLKKAMLLLENSPFRVLLVVWLLVQYLLYQHYGIKIVYDSHRYFNYVDSLAAGGNYWYTDSGKFYASYTFLLALMLHLAKLPVACIILLQVLVSGVAAVYLYKITSILSKNKTAPALAALLFIIWPDLQFWNLYIHTESLYISLSVFILFLTLVARRPHHYLVLAGLLTVICFLRPNGIFLVIAVGIALFYQRGFALRLKRMRVNAFVWLPVLFILLCAGIFFLEVFSPLAYYRAGQFIQGYKGNAVAVGLPSSTAVSQPVALQLLAILLEQPTTFLKLVAGRFFFFWTQVRPYYSALHNVVILLFFLPVYYYAISCICRIKHCPFLAFVLTLAALHTLMVTVIAVDWDNRFVAPLLPFIFVLAAMGMQAVWQGPQPIKS